MTNNYVKASVFLVFMSMLAALLSTQTVVVALLVTSFVIWVCVSIVHLLHKEVENG